MMPGELGRLVRESDALEAVWLESRTEPDRLRWRRLWRISNCCPGYKLSGREPIPLDRCTSTCLTRDVGEPDPDWRGACLTCGWVGPLRSSENGAAEDGQDHAWPGWRTLPVLASPVPAPGTTKDARRQLDRWIATARLAGYDLAWLEAGGPIRTARASRYGGRHVPDRTPWRGYDMADLVRLDDDAPVEPSPAEPAPPPPILEQLDLFATVGGAP